MINLKSILLCGVIAIFLTACNVDENPFPTQELFFGCYDPTEFGALRPEELNGLPSTCTRRRIDEDFSDNSLDWFERDDSDGRFDVTSGQYEVTTANINFYLRNPLYEDLGADYEASVDIRFGSGSNNASNAALSFAADGANFNGELYYLAINPIGQFAIGRAADGSTQPLVRSFQFSPALQTGTNNLMVRSWEGNFYCFINGELVYVLTGISPRGNRIGFRIQNATEVAFDNYRVVEYSGL